MQLLGPHINNHGSNKRKKTARQIQAELEHEAWLKRNGVHTSQLAQQKRGKMKKIFNQPVSKIAEGTFQDSGVTGSKREEQKYTGGKLVGIAVMHKSCLQPVFSKESAKDSANMRRN